MKCSHIALAVHLAINSLVLADDGDPPRSQPAMFKITTRKKDDAVEVMASKDKTVFVVKSPSGISQAVIERVEQSWPSAVVLRLHVKGLESLRASNGKVTLDAAVSSQDGKVRVWKDGKEDAQLDEKSPFWMGVRIVAGAGKAARGIPLGQGYFEVTLPKAFFEGSPKSITLSWIDFYRE